MKMIIAIVQDKFIDELIDTFLDEDIHVTKVSSSGGFFKSGNSTLMIGAEEEELDNIDKIFRKVTKTEVTKTDKGEFEISGATIFVIDVEKSMRI